MASNTSARTRQRSTRQESDSSALRQALREKKRIQDRESQRNVRQRTRDYIASLEAQVAELKSPACIAQLLAANEQLTSRVEELTATIASISKLIQISTRTEETHAPRSSPGRSNGPSHASSASPSHQTDMRAVEEQGSREALQTPPQHFNGEQIPSISCRPAPVVASPPEPTPPHSSTVLPDVLESSGVTHQTSNAVPDRGNFVPSPEPQQIQFGWEGTHFPAGLSQTADVRNQAGSLASMPNSPLGPWELRAGQAFDSMVIDNGYNLKSTFSNSNINGPVMDTGGYSKPSGPNSGSFVLGGPNPASGDFPFIAPLLHSQQAFLSNVSQHLNLICFVLWTLPTLGQTPRIARNPTMGVLYPNPKSVRRRVYGTRR
jgi:hypothetical protein